MASLSDNFCKLQGISTKYRTLLYQLTGDIQSRISENTKTLIKLVDQFEIGFVEELSLTLFRRQLYHLCLQHKLLIIPALNMPLIKFLFLIDSTEISVWSPMQKRNLKFFKANNKIIKKKVDNKVVQLHEEKNLLIRFLITARNRPELNL